MTSRNGKRGVSEEEKTRPGQRTTLVTQDESDLKCHRRWWRAGEGAQGCGVMPQGCRDVRMQGRRRYRREQAAWPSDLKGQVSEFELNFRLHLRRVTSLGGGRECDLALMAIIGVT